MYVQHTPGDRVVDIGTTLQHEKYLHIIYLICQGGVIRRVKLVYFRDIYGCFWFMIERAFNFSVLCVSFYIKKLCGL